MLWRGFCIECFNEVCTRESKESVVNVAEVDWAAKEGNSTALFNIY